MIRLNKEDEHSAQTNRFGAVLIECRAGPLKIPNGHLLFCKLKFMLTYPPCKNQNEFRANGMETKMSNFLIKFSIKEIGCSILLGQELD